MRSKVKIKTNSKTHFLDNDTMIEVSLIAATFWIPHTSFYVNKPKGLDQIAHMQMSTDVMR